MALVLHNLNIFSTAGFRKSEKRAYIHNMTTLIDSHDNIVARVEAAGERIQRVHKAASSVIFGQDEVIERTLVTILSGGHALLIGVPEIGRAHV